VFWMVAICNDCSTPPATTAAAHVPGWAAIAARQAQDRPLIRRQIGGSLDMDQVFPAVAKIIAVEEAAELSGHPMASSWLL
jgi:hypothetical protein